MFNKKALFTFSGDWAEYLFIVLIIVGFLMAATIENLVVMYLVAYILGFHCGILTYHNLNKNRTFPIWLIIGGLLLGFLIGSYKTNKFSIILLFVLGIINGHLLLKRNVFFFDKKKK
jgi:hypothetical protein